jgi:hypothetical protein
MSKIPKSDQSQNNRRTWKSEKKMSGHGPTDILDVKSGAKEK